MSSLSRQPLAVEELSPRKVQARTWSDQVHPIVMYIICLKFLYITLGECRQPGVELINFFPLRKVYFNSMMDLPSFSYPHVLSFRK